MSDQLQPTKAYRVEEKWTSYAISIVWADSVEGAKQAVRNGDEGNIEVVESIAHAAPGVITAKRLPEEDRKPKRLGGES